VYPPDKVDRSLLDGISQETCRDLEHVQYGLAAMMNAAETARIQGVDLYREQANRMAQCMEFAAFYLNQTATDDAGNIPSYTTPVNPAVTIPAADPTLCPNSGGKATVVLLNKGSLGSYVVQPTWETGYNALARRLGMSMPNTKQLITAYRTPPTGWVGITHHMGWDTLTHADVGDVGLGPATCGGP
jgi:hypothetical protein